MKGFYKGFTATCLKVLPTSAILFLVNNEIRKRILPQEELTRYQAPTDQETA
jgi:hypothetical protein